jgi:hypothetical protein
MYQTSLDQFQMLFDKSMEVSEKAALAMKRVNNIIESMTYITYRYINKGAVTLLFHHTWVEDRSLFRTLRARQDQLQAHNDLQDLDDRE